MAFTSLNIWSNEGKLFSFGKQGFSVRFFDWQISLLAHFAAMAVEMISLVLTRAIFGATPGQF